MTQKTNLSMEEWSPVWLYRQPAACLHEGWRTCQIQHTALGQLALLWRKASCPSADSPEGQTPSCYKKTPRWLQSSTCERCCSVPCQTTHNYLISPKPLLCNTWVDTMSFLCVVETLIRKCHVWFFGKEEQLSNVRSCSCRGGKGFSHRQTMFGSPFHPC